jgi:RNA polymerase sigma factor (sigma-70 family)
MQTVFLIVYRKVGLLDSAGALAGWIATISRHEVWRAMRGRRQREAREGPPVDADRLSATDPRPDENLERVERAFLVQRGLARIDKRCRGLIESMFWEEPRPSYEEMAARLGIQTASMPPTRARCLAKLRRALEELGW